MPEKIVFEIMYIDHILSFISENIFFFKYLIYIFLIPFFIARERGGRVGEDAREVERALGGERRAVARVGLVDGPRAFGSVSEWFGSVSE